MFKKLFLVCAYILSLNAADPVPVNQKPYVVFRDQGKCDYMQDRSCAIIESDHAFFGVFDGHGTKEEGHVIADFLSKNLYKNVIADGMQEGFVNCDLQMTEELGENIMNLEGSTSSVVLIKDNKIHVGHVGDSKIVLIRNNEVIELTNDHTPNDKDPEYQRIKTLTEQNNKDFKNIIRKYGHQWYVVSIEHDSALTMTRAFGDRHYSPYVISTPQINVLDQTTEDEFLILATDGIWDVLKPQDVWDILKSYSDWAFGGQRVVGTAKTYWQMGGDRIDNIEIVVVNLKLLKEQQEQKALSRLIADVNQEEDCQLSEFH